MDKPNNRPGFSTVLFIGGPYHGRKQQLDGDIRVVILGDGFVYMPSPHNRKLFTPGGIDSVKAEEIWRNNRERERQLAIERSQLFVG